MHSKISDKKIQKSNEPDCMIEHQTKFQTV